MIKRKLVLVYKLILCVKRKKLLDFVCFILFKIQKFLLSKILKYIEKVDKLKVEFEEIQEEYIKIDKELKR